MIKTKNKILLNRPNKVEIVAFILGGLLLFFLFPNWTNKMIFLLMYLFILFGLADNRNFWFTEQKTIVSHLSFFRRSESLITKVCKIEYVNGWGSSVPAQVKLTIQGNKKKCSCFNLEDEEFKALFNQIFEMTNSNEISWNKDMEKFEPFVNSNFGSLIFQK